jgi:tetratricopeptide (TPR) repeat protein
MLTSLFAILITSSCTMMSLADDAVQVPQELVVNDIASVLVLGNDRNTRLRFDIKVTVTNSGDAPLSVDRKMFRLHAGEVPLEPTPSNRSEPLEATELAPKNSVSGWLTFPTIAYNGPEIPLELEWTRDRAKGEDQSDPNAPTDPPQTVKMNVNELIRKLNVFDTAYVGSDRELAVVTVHRTLDLVAVWVLCDQLKQISEQGVQRVILTPDKKDSPALQVECVQFLATLSDDKSGNSPEIPSSIPLPKTAVKLKHVSLADFSEASERVFRNPRLQVAHYRTLDDAVCAALTPIYRYVPVEKAVADLRNPDSGVRRAAMAGAVDRLTAEQASAIIEQAQSGSTTVKMEIAAYLNLIPGEAAVEALKEMCLGDNEDVAKVALRSLVRSRDNAAESAMADVWKAGTTTPKLQSEVVQAILEYPDERWMPLVVDYVLVFLRQAAQPDSATIPSKNVGGALRFLSAQNESRIEQAIRKDLLNIRNPSIQDMFVQHLMNLRVSGNDNLIRECVTRRLREGQVSAIICTAAMRYRDPTWTEPLLASFQMAAKDEGAAAQFLNAALECASPEQLEQIAENPAEYSVPQQAAIIQHLARLEHPRWKSLATELLEKKERHWAQVIPLLSQDASEESLKILCGHAQAYAAGLEGTRDASVEGMQMYQTLLIHLAAFVHPECRRTLNRLARDPNKYISELALSQQGLAFRSAPGFSYLMQESQLRREGKQKEAAESLKLCLEVDPLMPEAHVRVASEEMHAERFAEAMAALKTADQLSPEDIETQSMIALVMVRLDDIQGGLAYADKVIAMAPQDWTSLYNGACTYARATESKLPSEADKKTYADKAIELIRQTAALKFNDSEHMQKDPDLLSLHDHEEWSKMVELVNANKPPAPLAP